MRRSPARAPPWYSRAMEGLAVVTGASAGIGRAVAIALAEAGLEVIAVARRARELEDVAATPRIHALPADVTGREGVARIGRAVGGRPLAVLVHGAGVFPRRRLPAQHLRWAPRAAGLRGGPGLHVGGDGPRVPADHGTGERGVDGGLERLSSARLPRQAATTSSAARSPERTAPPM